MLSRPWMCQAHLKYVRVMHGKQVVDTHPWRNQPLTVGQGTSQFIFYGLPVLNPGILSAKPQ